MALNYKFKKEKLADGSFTSRPRIFIVLNGPDASIETPALIDSGCDITVIPQSLAQAIGMDVKGDIVDLHAFRETNEVVSKKANFTFEDKHKRNAVKLENIPVLIALSKKGYDDEEDIVLGVAGIFDNFEITFNKTINKITLKQTQIKKQVKQK